MNTPETITIDEVTALLQAAGARDQRTQSAADNLAWYQDLNTARVNYTDASAALSHYYANVWPRQDPAKRFRATAPVLIELVLQIRKQRLADSNYVHEPRFGETGAQYVTRLRAETAAIADGRTPPQPISHALRARPVQQLIAAVADRRALPPEIADILALSRPAPGTVTCPHCGAPPKTPCRNRAGRMHPSRIDAWAVAVTGCPECHAAPGDVCQQLGRPYAHGVHRARLDTAQQEVAA
jgi:hypothetical protein